MREQILNANIPKTILKLAWPNMLGFLMQVSYNIADTIFVGRLGAEAIAAVSLAFPIDFFMYALGGGLVSGTTSLISRYIGAKEYKNADNAAEHSFLIALVLSLFFTVIGLLFMKPLFIFLGATSSILPMSIEYSRWIFLGSASIFFFLAASAIIRSEGDMRTSMKFMGISVVLNLILDPLFIFGISIFGISIIPPMGVAGAAIATVIARVVGCVLVLNHLLKDRSMIKLRLKDFRYKYLFIKNIFAVGIPSSLSQLVMSVGVLLLTKLTANFGETAIAAYGIGFKLDTVAFLPTLGIGIAILTMVGQNTGAKNFVRAKKISWTGCLIAGFFMLTISLIFLSAPEFFISIFNNDPILIRYGVSYLKYIAPTYIFLGFIMILAFTFQGFGRGVPGVVIAIFRLGIIAVPLAYLLALNFGFGLTGVWIAIAVSNVLTALFSVGWFYRFKANKAM
ncbi:MATE family efflux transporter [Candidatus Woesearchaeota archaeon]|nr:MATE family efflux transporter [Candidatus Woesearchaeota archaeon]